MAAQDLTAARLREFYVYSPESGIFFRRERPSRRLGTKARTGYVHITIDGRTYPAHRLAWLYSYGDWPPEQIDHINRIRDDNRLANLRLASAGENMQNRELQRNNKSGCPGVHHYKKTNKWRARIKRNGVFIELGLHSDLESAVAAYQKAKAELSTHFVA